MSIERMRDKKPATNSQNDRTSEAAKPVVGFYRELTKKPKVRKLLDRLSKR